MPRRITLLALIDSNELADELVSELSDADELLVVRTLAAACKRLRRDTRIDLALIPDHADSLSAMAIAQRLHAVRPALPVVVVAAAPESRDVVMAVQAQEILQAVQREWRPGELASALLRAYETGFLRAEVESLRMRMHRRIDALAALHEVSAATTDLPSYTELTSVIAQGLRRVLRFDTCAIMIAPGGPGGESLHLHCQDPSSGSMLADARDMCLDLMRRAAAPSLDEKHVTVAITGAGSDTDDDGDDMRVVSSMHAPITIDGQVAGMMLVCTRSEHTFPRDDQRLLFFLANRTAESVKRLGQRLSGARRRLSHMVESMADGLIMTDIGQDDVLINPAARRLLGILADTDVTTSFLKDKLGFYPFDLVTTRSATGGVAGPLREEVRIGDRILHSMVSPVRDRDGTIEGVVVVLRDMTEAKALARRQNEFVSVVSHELRTPLTSITGSLDIVLSMYSGQLSDKQRRYLRMARESCTQLNTIVDDLLDVARSESGKMAIMFTQIELDGLASEVVDRFRPAARLKHIKLDVVSDRREIRIMGDPERLTQVLNNLLSNAMKFTPNGGSVDVEIFGPSVASDHVGVSVSNNGQPIPERDRERIFDKFEQLEDSSTRRVGGTGLGLAISRAIIEAHQGRIWVEPRDDGTKFVFTLPSAPDEETAQAGEAVAAAADASPPPVDKGTRVLIVNDEARSTYILKGIFIAAGYEVVLAPAAAEAVTEARRRRPDIVVIDASEDTADALALVEIFKHDPDTRRTSVLVLGGHAEREQALRVGADDFLHTPVAPPLLRDTCARLLADARGDSAAKVMLVDDDAAIRSICRDILQSAGFAIREAASGKLALQEAKRFRPDLLILDVMMPELDGFQTAERFRSDPSFSLTPIIFVSARGETSDKVRAFRIGAEDYIVKPFDAAELVARVVKALERRSRELGASPTTRLPGADAIESEIERRLTAHTEQAFCYLDLDNLKAFNDYYGYAKADGMIRQTGDLIRDVIAREGDDADFIGHIAGDDFVFITSAERVDRVCESLCATFNRLVPLYYNKNDRERGYIETKDRYGVMRRFPIMTVSVAAVIPSTSGVRSFAQLAVAAARGKELAKRAVGSSYVRDGEVLQGALPPEEGEATSTTPA